MGSLDSLSQDEIPTVDMSSFLLDSSPDEKQRTAKDFAEKCGRSGCLRITGHGISLELVRKAFATCKQLYELPYEDKMKAPHPPSLMPHRGYSGVGGEKGAPKAMYDRDAEGNKLAPEDGDGHFKNIDYKESWDIGSDGNKEQENIWLPEDVFPGFRDFTSEFYWKLAETSNMLLELMMAGLGLEGAEASAIREIHISGHYNQLRLLHYLPIPASKTWSKDENRLGAHTDLGTFTIGFQNMGGIEYLDRKTDKWLAAGVEEGALYLNIADMMTRISNDHYPGGMHRVTIPSPDADGTVPGRHSLIYFVSPSFKDTIATPKSLIERDGGPAHYEPTTMEQYLKDIL